MEHLNEKNNVLRLSKKICEQITSVKLATCVNYADLNNSMTNFDAFTCIIKIHYYSKKNSLYTLATM